MDFSQATYLQLVMIVKALWPRFEAYFVDEKGKPMGCSGVTKRLFDINEKRKYLAHSHKAKQHGWEPKADDVAALKQGLEMIRLASARVT